MNARQRTMAWVMVVLLALAGTQAALAAPPAATGVHPAMNSPAISGWTPVPVHLTAYGEPVSDELLDQLDGEWAQILIGGAYGALGGALNYTVATYGNDWNWQGFTSATVTGAVSGAVSSLFGSPLWSVTAGSVTGGLISRWW